MWIKKKMREFKKKEIMKMEEGLRVNKHNDDVVVVEVNLLEMYKT